MSAVRLLLLAVLAADSLVIPPGKEPLVEQLLQPYWAGGGPVSVTAAHVERSWVDVTLQTKTAAADLQLRAPGDPVTAAGAPDRFEVPGLVVLLECGQCGEQDHRILRAAAERVARNQAGLRQTLWSSPLRVDRAPHVSFGGTPLKVVGWVLMALSAAGAGVRVWSGPSTDRKRAGSSPGRPE